jgi:NADH dehydrogenase
MTSGNQMGEPELHVVTGAFGYSGRYITERLLRAGRHVRTLTHSPDRAHPFGDRVEIRPFHFQDPDRLAASVAGARVLYNTYWVRFNHRDFRYAQAVENTRTLFAAARRAGVARVVHVSITNPSEDSPLEYFRGKATLERALRESGLSHAILRPAVLFGGEDILINNMAWSLRHLPAFGVFGDGQYRMQPIHVHHFADLAVAQGLEGENRTIDAIGPETYRYGDLVRELARILGLRRPVVSVPPRLGYAAGWLLGQVLGDVLITWDEVQGLMADLLVTDSKPTGAARLSAWAREHAATLGLRYATELGRRRDRRVAYAAAR